MDNAIDKGTDTPAPEHQRPDGVSDETVEAVGRLTEALEAAEEARGHLYVFHRLCGSADTQLRAAVEHFREAGHDEIADRLQTDLVGRNTLEGRWSFQVVEDYDDGYHSAFKSHEAAVRDELLEGRRHVYESEMKEARRTHGRPGHEARPS